MTDQHIDTERRIRVLVIRLSSIGDIVQCTSAARHLKKRFPLGQVDWVVRSDNAELLTNNPYVTRVIAFDRKAGLKGWFELCKSLSHDFYTHVYDAHNNWRSHILCWVLKSPLVIRRSKNRLKRFLLHYLKIDLFGRGYLTSDSFVAPLATWGITNDKKGPELFLSRETFEKTADLFSSSEAKWVALAPATAWPKKSWPIDYWKSLVRILLEKTNFQILIVGGTGDTFCETLVLDNLRVKNLQGELSLLESAAAVQSCETLIAADTGILHMAEAVGINVIALLGPTWFGHPQREKSVAIQTNLWCQPCSKDGSGPCINLTYQKCMKLILPEGVWNSFESAIFNRKPRS